MRVAKPTYINFKEIGKLKVWCKQNDINYYACCDAKYKASVKAKKKGVEFTSFKY